MPDTVAMTKICLGLIIGHVELVLTVEDDLRRYEPGSHSSTEITSPLVSYSTTNAMSSGSSMTLLTPTVFVYGIPSLGIAYSCGIILSF